MLKWEDLPVEMQSSEVESYYQLVSKRKGSLIFKRCLDWVLALVLLVLASPIFLILSICHLQARARDPVQPSVQDLEVPYHGNGCG